MQSYSSKVGQPAIVLISNTAWNLAHFRAPLLRALSERGFSLIAHAPEDSSVSKLRSLSCQFEPVKMLAHSRNPWTDLLLFLKYIGLLWRFRPVAVLSFTVKPNIYGGLAARLLGITQIGNISGLGTAFIQGGWMGRLVQGLYRLSLARARTVFFQNPDDRELFLAKRLVRKDQAALLPGSGVHPQHFAPIPVGESRVEPASGQRPFAFLFIGRLLGDKGLLELVQAINLLRNSGPRAPQALSGLNQHPALSPRLIILGPDGGTNPTAISSKVLDQWRQDPQLELLGSVEDVRPFIARADCVVLPSYREGTPRSLLEAAAMGKPLIATDVPGCRQAVIDGHNGYLCKVKDPQDLARAMRQMMELASNERQAMGQVSRKLAEEVFDEKLVVQKYLQALGLEASHDSE